MNKCILFGNVGKDPDVKKINDNTVAKFSLATNKSYTNNAGEKITETQWHNIILWGKLAELASKYVKKGSSIIIEGEINYRSYENKEEITVYVTEIIGHALHFAGTKKEEEQKPQGKQETKSMSNINDLPQHVQEQQEVSELDDLPC